MKRPIIHHGWVVLGICCLCMVLTSAVWYTFSVFYATIVEHFKWGRADTALAFSAMVIVGGLADPLVGQLVDRIGARFVFPIGGVLLGLGLLGASRIDSLWELYIAYGLLLALGKSGAGMVPIGTVLQHWFRRRIGTANGIVAASVAGGMLVVPLVEKLIAAVGWRNAYVVLGVICLALVPLPAWLLVRQRPQDVGLLPDGRFRDSRGSGVRPGVRSAGDDRRIVDAAWASRDWTPRLALRTHRFWFLFAGMLTGVLSHQLVLVHQVAYIADLGYGLALGSFVYGMMGISSGFAKFGWGWISDRIGRELAYSAATLGLLGGVAALIGSGNAIWLLYPFSLLFGVGYAAGAPLYPASGPRQVRLVAGRVPAADGRGKGAPAGIE
ncbi:MAG: MFS transporter [Chloroflexi bacterium]|nr:MFS transporter [Chloroflexota bacterium]